MAGPTKRFRFWEREYSLTALLVMLVLTLFVVTPLAGSAIIGSEITLCFVAVLTITGMVAVTGRRSVLVLVILLAVIVTIQISRPGNVTHHRVQGAIFGQLYPAVMIARLISLEILDRRRGPSV